MLLSLKVIELTRRGAMISSFHHELKHKPGPLGLFIFSKVTLALLDELMDVSALSIVSSRH